MVWSDVGNALANVTASSCPSVHCTVVKTLDDDDGCSSLVDGMARRLLVLYLPTSPPAIIRRLLQIILLRAHTDTSIS